MPNDEKKTIQVRISKDLYDRITAAAKQESTSRPNVSRLARRALAAAFPRQSK